MYLAATLAVWSAMKWLLETHQVQVQVLMRRQTSSSVATQRTHARNKLFTCPP